MTVKPDDTQFLHQFRGSATGLKLAAEIEARRIADRQTHADAMEKMDREAGPAYLARTAEIERLCKARDALEKQFREAAAKAAYAVAVSSATSMIDQQQRWKHEGHLIESADPAVALFIREMWDAIPETHKLVDETVSEERNRLMQTNDRKVITNVEQVNARIASIRAAIVEAEALRLRPDQSGVAARLDALRAGLPVVKPVPRPALPAEKKGGK